MYLPQVAPLDASKLSVTLSTSETPLPPSSSLVFGQTFSSHMLTCSWSIKSGWGTPEIKPYGPLALDPSSTVLHYAQTLFEGMKAYKDLQGRSRLFRPDLNMKRMKNGAEKMAFPDFDADELIKLIQELVRIDDRWIPTEPGCSLYIRPTMIGTRASLGVGPSTEVLLYVICSPVAKYYASGAKPISLLCNSKEKIRAWPGGTGDCKFGSNYGPVVEKQIEAAQRGYQQVLWVLEREDGEALVTEVGMMNAFVALRMQDGAIELVTPPLTGLVLPGVTRDSILSLARQHESGSLLLPNLESHRLVVSERQITMSEILLASQAGRLVEAFGSGTAAVITSVEKIGYKGEDIQVPVDGGEEGDVGFGRIAGSMMKTLSEIQYGQRESEWSWIC